MLFDQSCLTVTVVLLPVQDATNRRRGSACGCNFGGSDVLYRLGRDCGESTRHISDRLPSLCHSLAFFNSTHFRSLR